MSLDLSKAYKAGVEAVDGLPAPLGDSKVHEVSKAIIDAALLEILEALKNEVLDRRIQGRYDANTGRAISMFLVHLIVDLAQNADTP